MSHENRKNNKEVRKIEGKKKNNSKNMSKKLRQDRIIKRLVWKWKKKNQEGKRSPMRARENKRMSRSPCQRVEKKRKQSLIGD